MNSVSLPVDWALEKLLASSPKAQFAGDDVDGVQVAAWSLQRRCSLTPQQLGTGYACLVLASALVAAVFWLQGVRMVALFSTFEVLTVGLAFAWHAMHAADGEQLLMQDDHLWVEQRRGFYGGDPSPLPSPRRGEGEMPSSSALPCMVKKPSWSCAHRRTVLPSDDGAPLRRKGCRSNVGRTALN